MEKILHKIQKIKLSNNNILLLDNKNNILFQIKESDDPFLFEMLQSYAVCI